jgi:hypothetical protein
MACVEPEVYFQSEKCCVKDSEIHGKGLRRSNNFIYIKLNIQVCLH